LIDGILARDRRSLARAATLLENGSHPGWLSALASYAGKARIVGLTGPPGAGKSTFATALLKEIRAQGLTVALIAVDPSSHRSGGAILGDRIRMVEHTADEGIFIRSMATRGQLGGLAPATHRLVTLFDAAGFDVVLIETVGVGQDEIAVARLAHCVVVLFVPGQGDEIQAMKSGIMEIADLFVVNKADLPGADKLYFELEAEAHGRAPVLKTIATTGEGMPQVWQAITQHKAPARPAPPTDAFPIDHLGIAVPSIDEALRFWRDALGLPLAYRETVGQEQVHVAMLPAGESRLELLEASGKTSTIAKFIAKRGPGLHHIAIRVRNLEATAARLASQGARLLNEPRTGAGGHRYIFVHPASTGGVLLELIEERSQV
jgi:LAO/AO transport system kinase